MTPSPHLSHTTVDQQRVRSFLDLTCKYVSKVPDSYQILKQQSDMINLLLIFVNIFFPLMNSKFYCRESANHIKGDPDVKKIESEFVFEEDEVPEATDSSPPQHHDEPQPPSNSYASSVVSA